jgi:dethiobiotin synthetase
MKALFITATNTDVGKTYATLKLMEHFANKGYRVGAFKPIETGVTDNNPLDATTLFEASKRLNPHFEAQSPLEITSYTFALPAAPFCANKHQSIKIEKIIQKYHQLRTSCDILFVEGAGGLFVPITQHYMMIDLIQELDIKTLLITPSRLGSINDTLLSMEALKHKEIDFDWCVNLYDDKESFATVTQPYYDASFEHWWRLDQLEDQTLL